MTNARILIVDDEKNIISVLRMALELYEYQIDEAGTGTKAYELISTNKYDCILLDMRLPGMDGLEILRQLNPPNVILITAHGTIDNAVEAMKLGCVDFIRKPFEVEAVRIAVQKVLARKQIAFEQNLEFESYIEAAKLEVSNRHYSKAQELISQALAVKPDSAEAFNFLGVLHEIKGDLAKAIAAYRNAHNLDPTYSPAQENLSRILTLNSDAHIILGKNK